MSWSRSCSSQQRCLGENCLLTIIWLVRFHAIVGWVSWKSWIMCCVLMWSHLMHVNFFSSRSWLFSFANCRLVNKINNSIGQDPNSKFLIGVLDIYGFESFKTNRCLTGMLLSLSLELSKSLGILRMIRHCAFVCIPGFLGFAMRAFAFVIGVVKILGVLWMTQHCALSASWACFVYLFAFHVCACVTSQYPRSYRHNLVN